MSQPTNYTPTTDFSQQEAIAASGRSTVNTAALDAEFANIETTLDQTLVNLALLQRDDGKLRDTIVEPRCLDQSVLTLMGGFNLRGLWAPGTVYKINDITSNGAYTYVCQADHTSDALFSAGNWIQFGFTSGADAAAAAAAAQVSAADALASANSASSASSTATTKAATATTQASSALLSASRAATQAGAASSSAANAASSAASAAASAAAITPATPATDPSFLDNSTSPASTSWVRGAMRAISGTATNDSAAAGIIGEYVESAFSGSSQLANAVSNNCVSMTLSAGDWDVMGIVEIGGTSATITRFAASISAVSATLDAIPIAQQYSGTYTTGASGTWSICPLAKRISISAPTTVYLVTNCYFGSGTLAITGGLIRARRVR